LRIKLHVTGLKEMDQNLRALGPNITRKLVGNSLKKAAELPLSEAKRLVSVRTGALRDSLMTQQLPMKNTDRTRAVIIGGRKPIGSRSHWQEFGTVHHAAKPFLRPALDSTAQVTVNAFGRHLGPGIEREAAQMNRTGRR